MDKLEDGGSRFKLLGERKILPRMCLSPRMELFGRLPHQIEVHVAIEEAFGFFITPTMADLIALETNCKARRKVRQWNDDNPEN